MLGLGHQGTDSAVIKERKLQVVNTQIDLLPFIWQYAQHLGIVKADIVRKYNLRSQTLTCIERGQVLTRGTDRYVDSLIRALNNQRIHARHHGNDLLAKEIEFALFEICLLRAGIATDHEMVLRLKEADDAKWRQKMVREGVLAR